MAKRNPYEPPRAPLAPEVPATAGAWVACPSCNGAHVVPVGFTWWGGVIGAKLLSHVECRSCGHRYNGKTGRSNTPAIIVYQGVVLAIVVGITLLRC